MARPVRYSADNFHKDLKDLSKKYARLSNLEKNKVYGKEAYESGNALSAHNLIDGFLLAFGLAITKHQDAKEKEEKEKAKTPVKKPVKRGRKSK